MNVVFAWSLTMMTCLNRCIGVLAVQDDLTELLILIDHRLEWDGEGGPGLACKYVRIADSARVSVWLIIRDAMMLK
jgi:hypothetical protein